VLHGRHGHINEKMIVYYKGQKLFISSCWQKRSVSNRLPSGTARLAEAQVTSGSGGDLVDTSTLLPSRAAALDDRNDFLGNTQSKHVTTTAARLALGSSVQDPLKGSTATLTETKRDGNLQGNTTTGSTTLRADAQQRGDAVDGECKVKDRVQRKVGWWGC
jgi:hypothetical protein